MKSNIPKCPSTKAALVRDRWQLGLRELRNGKSIEKAFQWEDILNEDSIIVNNALNVAKVFADEEYGQYKWSFLEKVASSVPSSHSKALLLSFFFSLLKVKDSRDLRHIINLVNYYPVAVNHVQIFFEPHFTEATSDRKKMRDLITWSNEYFRVIFDKIDSTSLTTVDWLSKFKGQAVCEYLLNIASKAKPVLTKAEYWLFQYRILSVVAPSKPPTFVSINKFMCVLFSVAASVTSASPYSPVQFIMIGYPLFTHLTLTPGLTGLLTTIMLKFPSADLLPIVRHLLDRLDAGRVRNFLGCLVFPLTYIGVVYNDPKTTETVIELCETIYCLRFGSDLELSMLSQDDYSTSCIKTQTTINSLKIGQVLSHVAEKGSKKLIEKRLAKATLSLSTASILCHCLLMSNDRPTDDLLYVFEKSDDTTNGTLLEFVLTKTYLIREKRVLYTTKFITLYLQNIRLLVKHASRKVLQGMIKRIVNLAMEYKEAQILLYELIWHIWEDHGGVVYEEFYSLLKHAISYEQPVHEIKFIWTIVSILEKMCESNERQLDFYPIKTLLMKYRTLFCDDPLVQQKTLSALVHLCGHGMEFLDIKDVVDKYRNDTNDFKAIVANYYTTHFVRIENLELQLEAFALLKDLSESDHHKTASTAFRGLCEFIDENIEFIQEFDEGYVQRLVGRKEHPDYSVKFLSKLLDEDLRSKPLQPSGTNPNPSKSLVQKFKLKIIRPDSSLLRMLFSFPLRAQPKFALSFFESIIAKSHITLFKSYYDGIMLIEGWCYFMYQYACIQISNPRSRNKTMSVSEITKTVESIKQKLLDIIGSKIAIESEKNFIKILFLTSFVRAVVRIFAEKNYCLSEAKKIGAPLIGLIRTLHFSHKPLDETKSICLLAMAHVTEIAKKIDDEELISMIFKSSVQTLRDCRGEPLRLVLDCAGIGVAVSLRTMFLYRGSSKEIRETLQDLIDMRHFLGMTFCIDVLNIAAKDVVNKFREGFAGESSESDHLITLDYILFVTNCRNVRILEKGYHDIEERQNFIYYIAERIEATEEDIEKQYLFMILGRLHYLDAQIQMNDTCQKSSLTFAKEMAMRVNDCDLGALALTTGFPINNFLSSLDWGPDLDLIVTYSDNIVVDDEGEAPLMIARYLEENPVKVTKYSNNGGPLWNLIYKQLSELIAAGENRDQIRFIFKVMINITNKLPLTKPISALTTVYYGYNIQDDVIELAGKHCVATSKDYFSFLEPFLSLTYCCTMPIVAQKTIITQMPIYLTHVSTNDYPYFFKIFLRSVFLEGIADIRLEIINQLHRLVKDNDNVSKLIVSSFSSLFFSQGYHLFAPTIVDALSDFMIALEYYNLPLQYFAEESKYILNFICKQTFKDDISVIMKFMEQLPNQSKLTPDFLRATIEIITSVDETKAFDIIHRCMSIATTIVNNDNNNLVAAVCCVGYRIAAYLVYLTHQSSFQYHGLPYMFFTDDILEHKVLVDCLAEVLPGLEKWHTINKLFNQAIPDM